MPARTGRGFPSRPTAFLRPKALGGAAGFTSDWGIVRLIADTEYTGTVTVFLEIHGKTSDVTKPLVAYLKDITSGAIIVGSLATTAATTKTRARSAAFSFDTGSNVYGVDFGGNGGATHTLYDAVLRVVSA